MEVIFLIISRIMNWVRSQFLNINFKRGSRTPELSKVEFIVTWAAVMMFLVKLVFLLCLINLVHSLKTFGKSLKSNCEEELCFSFDFLTMVSSKQIFFPFLTCSSSPSNFIPIAYSIIVSAFSVFSNMI